LNGAFSSQKVMEEPIKVGLGRMEIDLDLKGTSRLDCKRDISRRCESRA